MPGQIVTLPEGLRAKCTDCLSPLDWARPYWGEDMEKYYASCCGHRYTMYPETMRLEREQD